MQPETPDTEKTLPGTPTALALRGELERMMPRLVGEIAAAVVNAITPRLQRLELAQETLDARQVVLTERIDELERLMKHPKTLPSPPPEAA